MKFNIKIEEIPTVEKWVINDEYNFKIELIELSSILRRVLENTVVDKYDIEDNLAKFLLDNNILKYEDGEYLRDDNFDDYCNELDKLIYNV